MAEDSASGSSMARLYSMSPLPARVRKGKKGVSHRHREGADTQFMISSSPETLKTEEPVKVSIPVLDIEQLNLVLFVL
jgi:hypothetical protein